MPRSIGQRAYDLQVIVPGGADACPPHDKKLRVRRSPYTHPNVPGAPRLRLQRVEPPSECRGDRQTDADLGSAAAAGHHDRRDDADDVGPGEGCFGAPWKERDRATTARHSQMRLRSAARRSGAASSRIDAGAKAETPVAPRSAIHQAGPRCQALADGIAVRIDTVTDYVPDVSVRCGDRLPPGHTEIGSRVTVVEVISKRKLRDYSRLLSVPHAVRVGTWLPDAIRLDPLGLSLVALGMLPLL